jgi:hypothetical protein
VISQIGLQNVLCVLHNTFSDRVSSNEASLLELENFLFKFKVSVLNVAITLFR